MSRWSPWLAACALAVTSCTPEPSAELAPLTGQQIFLAKCSACHQADGRGIPFNCPPLSTSPRLAGPPEDIIRIMLLGMKGRIVRDGQTYNGIMPSWRFDLNDAQIAAVINGLSQRWKPGFPEVTVELVSRIREETAGRKMFPGAKDLGLPE